MAKARAEGFEEHLKELERILEELEGGDLTLDASLGRYQEGIARLKTCYDLLSKAEKQVTVLQRDAEGNLKEEPFSIEGA
ncbi:MAG: exodeoxyribonuclease VII small subunit [Planctomycetaceae bacterium]